MGQISKSLEETQKIAGNFLDSLEPEHMAVVVALQGDLGSGKTTFTQAVGSKLGIDGEIQSPTFVIEKIYEIDPARSGQAEKGFKRFIHIDAYRLEKEEELLHLGWEKIISESENLIFIEWPENIMKIIPENAKKISFEFVDENTRKITINNEQ